MATASTEVLTGSSGTSTKPVPNVPTSAPAVAHADSPPTIVPLVRRSRSCQWATAGDTALRTAATGTSAANVTPMAPPVPPPPAPPPRADGPSQRTIGTVSSASSPPPIRRPTTRRPGCVRSATRPPIAAPTEIPSRTAPNDRRRRFQREAHVWREQAHREDLEDEDTPSRNEDGPGRQYRRQRRGGDSRLVCERLRARSRSLRAHAFRNRRGRLRASARRTVAGILEPKLGC